MPHSLRLEITSGDAGWPRAAPLLQAVWPPEVVATLPWRDVAWAHADRRVLAFDAANAGTDFGLLLCEPRHAPVYESLGWHRFDGPVFAEQSTGRVRFNVTEAYVLPMALAPQDRMLDLCGLPW